VFAKAQQTCDSAHRLRLRSELFKDGAQILHSFDVSTRRERS
jgi:hypothetical protein